MENQYKDVWTTDDFEQMEWHDNKIYAVAFGINEHKIAIDLDYILEWKGPEGGKAHYEFLIAPATLVFTNVHDISINLLSPNPIVDEIHRTILGKPKNSGFIEEQIEYEWTIETTEGEITFKSVGFIQSLKGDPKMLDRQSIGSSERGGISFDIQSGCRA